MSFTCKCSYRWKNGKTILDEFNKLKKKIEEFNDYETEKHENIKKLKFYEFDDFLVVSEKIEEYLSEFTDKLENILS